MNYQRTASSLSKISKSKSNFNKKSSLFSKRKARPATKSKLDSLKKISHNNDDEFENLSNVLLENPDTIRLTLLPDLKSKIVDDIITCLHSHMFAPIPNRSSGISSTRISHILNWRSKLPHVVSVSQIYSLSNSPTSVEREIASKIQQNVIRKISLSGRGDLLILMQEWERIINENNAINESLKEKYMNYVRSLKNFESLVHLPFTSEEIKLLIHQGFLISKNQKSSSSISQSFIDQPSNSISSSAGISFAGQRFISGTPEAGGSIGKDQLNGGGIHKAIQSSSSLQNSQTLYSKSKSTHNYDNGNDQNINGNFKSTYIPTVPNLGPYFKLLSSARTRLLSLLSSSGPYKSLPIDRLRERWNGGAKEIGDILGDIGNEEDTSSTVLPGRTVKWKDLYGLQFEWILTEAIGSGLVECFKTGSVGSGIRVV